MIMIVIRCIVFSSVANTNVRCADVYVGKVMYSTSDCVKFDG